MLRAHRVGHQILGPLQDPVAGVPVVQSTFGQYVPQEDGVAQHRTSPRIRAARLFVAGRSESQLAGIVIAGQRIENRRLVVVRTHAIRVPRPGPA